MDIMDLFKYDIEDREWSQILNGQRQWTEAIDTDSLRDFMTEMNEIYCEENSLCPVCRSELIDCTENYEIWGSVHNVYEKRCPKGCS